MMMTQVYMHQGPVGFGSSLSSYQNTIAVGVDNSHRLRAVTAFPSQLRYTAADVANATADPMYGCVATLTTTSWSLQWLCPSGLVPETLHSLVTGPYAQLSTTSSLYAPAGVTDGVWVAGWRCVVTDGVVTVAAGSLSSSSSSLSSSASSSASIATHVAVLSFPLTNAAPRVTLSVQDGNLTTSSAWAQKSSPFLPLVSTASALNVTVDGVVTALPSCTGSNGTTDPRCSGSLRLLRINRCGVVVSTSSAMPTSLISPLNVSQTTTPMLMMVVGAGLSGSASLAAWGTATAGLLGGASSLDAASLNSSNVAVNMVAAGLWRGGVDADFWWSVQPTVVGDVNFAQHPDGWSRRSFDAIATSAGECCRCALFPLS